MNMYRERCMHICATEVLESTCFEIIYRGSFLRRIRFWGWTYSSSSPGGITTDLRGGLLGELDCRWRQHLGCRWRWRCGSVTGDFTGIMIRLMLLVMARVMLICFYMVLFPKYENWVSESSLRVNNELYCSLHSVVVFYILIFLYYLFHNIISLFMF